MRKVVKIIEKQIKTSKHRKKFTKNVQKQSKCLIFRKKTPKMSKTILKPTKKNKNRQTSNKKLSKI